MELVAFGDINKFGIKGRLRFTWEITEVCNFQCWYCEYKSNNKKHLAQKPTHDGLMKIINFYKEVSKVKKIYKILICAAEVTTIPNIYYYTNELSKSIDNDTLIQVNSNMSAPLSTYIKICNSILDNGNPMILFPSYHREFIDVYKFFDKIETLKEKYKDFNFSVMVPSFMIHSESCLSLAYKFNKTSGYENVVFSLDKIREVNMDFDQIFPEEKFDSSRHTLVSIYKVENEYKYKSQPILRPFVPNFKNYVCKCPEHMAMVRYNGNIDYCSFQYNTNSIDSIDSYQLKEAIICPLDHCPCDFDIPKFKMLEFPKLKEWTKEDILKLKKL